MDLNFQYPNQPEPVQEENQGLYVTAIILVTGRVSPSAEKSASQISRL